MIKKNLKVKRLMALALAFTVATSAFAVPVSASTDVEITDGVVSEVVEDVQLEDGVYSIPVKMWHATKDQASSGNGALSQTATIIVKDGKANLLVTYLPMNMRGTTTYVSELNYLTDMKYKEDGTLESYTEHPATVLSTYSAVDQYNAESSADPTVAGKAYPKDQMIPITVGEDEIFISIYVPISAPYLGYGKKHEARLILDYTQVTKADSQVILDKEEVAVPLKGTAKVTATTIGTEEAVTYTSSDEKVATVDSEGNITGVSFGSATITATANGVSTTCKVNVTLEDGEYQVPVSLWHAYKDEASMGNAGMEQTGTLKVKDGEATLELTFIPMTAGNLSGYLSEFNLMTNIVYNSNGVPESYDKVASTVLSTYDVVDEYNKEDSTDANVAGKLYPKTVSVPVELGQEYTWAHMYVPVMGVLGSGDCEARIKLDYSVFEPTISLDKTSASLYVGQTTTLKASVHGLSSTATWKSSNTKVATVSSTGKVTAKAAGTATITVTANGVSKTAKITVKAPTLTVSKTKVTITAGKTTTLTAKAVGASTKVTWKSSNTKVATVSSAGKITAKAAGTAKITVTANGMTKTVTVTVTKPTISLDKTKATVTAGKTTTLKAKAVGASTKVTWKSSNTKVATVSSAGKITAKTAGTVKITATANGVSKTATITVKAPTLKVSSSKVSLKVGKSSTIKATVSPKLAITYKSSNSKVVTVSKTGVIKAKKKGTANITVYSGGAKKVVKVTVK